MSGKKTTRNRDSGSGRLTWGAIVFVLLLIALKGEYAWAETQIEVVGIGYPPIQSSSTAQALLLARRAALLDAYRNALRATSQVPGADEEGQLLEVISGTVRGSTVLAAEYLEDGGVRLRTMVRVNDPPTLGQNRETGSASSGSRAPRTVSLARWQEIVRQFVRIAPAETGGGP
jgi:hypothetical protein